MHAALQQSPQIMVSLGGKQTFQTPNWSAKQATPATNQSSPVRALFP